MNGLRRTFLKSSAVAWAALAAGLLRPLQALADWNRAGFEAKNPADGMKAIGAVSPGDSKDIVLKVQEIAENGAVVPVEVTSRIPGTEAISILVEKNLNPLTATFNFLNGAEGYVSTRIKMAQTSNVRAVVKAGGKYYTTVREVKVTVGGCG